MHFIPNSKIIVIHPFSLGPCEKRSPIRHDDNLRTGEGDFVTPEKQKYIPAERPKQVKPIDNLTTSVETFEQREEISFIPAERPKAVKPTDQVINKQNFNRIIYLSKFECQF